MQQHHFRDHESLSKAAALRIIATVKENPESLICIATGSTPTRCYELLADSVDEQRNPFQQARIVKLDEWGSLPDDHPASCEFYIQKFLLKPLKIKTENYIAFKADAPDKTAECDRVEAALQEKGPIDLSVLGLGINGHLGFNEPASYLQPGIHVAKLTDQTQQHPMIQSAESKPSFGYTLGMANLLQSKMIILLVSGEHKRGQLKRLLDKKMDTEFPASFLWLHPNVHLFSDIELL